MQHHSARNVIKYQPVVPQHEGYQARFHAEGLTPKFLWFQLRRLSEVPNVRVKIFSGRSALVEDRERNFRGFVRQAKTYWDAAERTEGSSSALLYYYSLLQLAKAELLTHPDPPDLTKIRHGLNVKRTAVDSIDNDVIQITDGVFKHLAHCRTQVDIQTGTVLNLKDLLSIIPEIGLEMADVGTTRPPSVPAYHCFALNDREVWSFLLVGCQELLLRGEPALARLLNHYEVASFSDYPQWRDMFGLSTRRYGGGMSLLQSKQTFSFEGELTSMSVNQAIELPFEAMGHQMRPGGRSGADVYFSPYVDPDSGLGLPLDLARYAVIFYLSYVVRYHPAVLDPFDQPAQAFLMDSAAKEIPVNLLAGAVDGIARSFGVYDLP